MTLILTPALVAAASADRERHLANMRECQRKIRAKRATEAGRQAGRVGRPPNDTDNQEPKP
jgi:hypothetical protein